MLQASYDPTSAFRSLDELVAVCSEETRPAAQAGIQVLYDEVVARVPVSAKIHATKGKKQVYSLGNLRAAVYQAFNEKESGEGVSTYSVSWNKTKAFYGRFVEHGTAKMAARPFLRPAYDAKRQTALEVAREQLRARIKARRS